MVRVLRRSFAVLRAAHGLLVGYCTNVVIRTYSTGQKNGDVFVPCRAVSTASQPRSVSVQLCAVSVRTCTYVRTITSARARHAVQYGTRGTRYMYDIWATPTLYIIFSRVQHASKLLFNTTTPSLQRFFALATV